MAEMLPMYDGAAPQMGRQGFAVLPSVPEVKSAGREVEAALQAAADATKKYVDLHNFGVRQEVEAKRAENDLERDKEFARRSALANGAEGSFWNADGKRNDDAVAGFIAEWNEKDEQIARPYIGWEAPRRDQAESRVNAERVRENVELKTLEEESRRRRQAFENNLSLALETQNWNRAAAVIDDGWQSGELSEVEAKVRIAKIERLKERQQLAVARAAQRNNKVTAGQVTDDLLLGMRRGATKGAAGVQCVDPVADDRMAAFEEGMMVESSAALTLGAGGEVQVALSSAPSEVSMWQSARAQQGEYALGAHRKDVSMVAASVLVNENYAGLSTERKAKMIAKRAQVQGGADMWFDGDEDAYDGWLAQQAQALAGLGGAVSTADRMLSGAGGIDALLTKEVTNEEIDAAWEESRVYSEREKYDSVNDMRVKRGGSYLMPGLGSVMSYIGYLGERPLSSAAMAARQARYDEYKEQWAEETDRELKDFEADHKDFWAWYNGKKGVHEQRRAAFVKGVRDVYRQKAIDAVLGLRAERISLLRDGTRVELDGRNDWAVEQRVIRDVLDAPLTREEFGTLEALAEQETRMAVERQARAKKYAQLGSHSREKIAEYNEALRQDRAAAVLTPMPALDEAVLTERKVQEQQRIAAKKYGAGLVLPMRWDGAAGRSTDEPKVVLPAKMYAKIAQELGAKDGLYAVFPGRGVPVPVAPDEKAQEVQFNKPCFGLIKRGSWLKAELEQLVNGANVRIKFTKDSVKYDF